VNLLLDIGNSRLKWALCKGGVLMNMGAMPHKVHDCPQHVEQILAGIPKPTRIFASNVLGQQISTSIDARTLARVGVMVEYVVSGAEACGIRSGYREPNRLGSDRFAALVGAHYHFGCDCIVIDCGTAVTIDALLKDGIHLGGLISPGFMLMRESLMARITALETHRSASVVLFGRDTEEGVQSGCLRILAAGIEGTTATMVKDMSKDTIRLLCGGDAMDLAALLGAAYLCEPHLVLKGLAVMSES
jgi:type III pantothenate kinase